MVHYFIKQSPFKPSCFEIELLIQTQNNEEFIEVQLPSWRPGRYEIGNFARLITHFKAETNLGKACPFLKISKDRWKIQTNGATELHVHYTYQTEILNAGSTFRGEQVWLLNPVNCLPYVENYQHQSLLVHLEVPENWQVVSSLHLAKSDRKHVFQAVNYDQLADSPILLAPEINHAEYQIEKTKFHLWFHGISQFDWEKAIENGLVEQFKKFTAVQWNTMKSFAKGDFHFIMLIKPEFFYHGVEHLHSTVCVLGPASEFHTARLQEDLLGVSSHELFHVWNVKRIRPSEMQPYNYVTENYCRLGYVYEGITTYYGDLFLLRSGVFNWNQFKQTFDEQLQKHYSNYARLLHPVADASADTWLDGYVPGIPNRKTSIYTEGCLNAWMMDVAIRKNSNHQNSLDDLMRALDQRFGETSIGYQKENLIELFKTLNFSDVENHFDRFIDGCEDYTENLMTTARELGLNLISKQYYTQLEHHIGCLFQTQNGKLFVKSVAPSSPTEKASLQSGDIVLSINNLSAIEVYKNFNDFSAPIELIVERGSKIWSITLIINQEVYYSGYEIVKDAQASDDQKDAFYLWAKQQF